VAAGRGVGCEAVDRLRSGRHGMDVLSCGAALRGIDGRRMAIGQAEGSCLMGLYLAPCDQALGTDMVAHDHALIGQFANCHDVAIAAEDALAAGHRGIVNAIEEAHEPKIYTIDLVIAPDRKSYAFRFTRHVHSQDLPRTPRMAIYGSGAYYLAQDKSWIRSLLRVVRANDRGHLSALAVADHLANLNYEVHCGISDKSVGPRCIVAWRHRKGGVHNGGGGHQFYTGTARDAGSPLLPTIAGGMDVQALLKVEMPRFNKRLETMLAGEPPVEENKDEINAELARLPDKPDENLR
jgi:hypothetical protein